MIYFVCMCLTTRINYNNKLSSSHIVVFTFESESILDCAADPSSHSFHFHFLRPLLPSPFLYYLNVIGLIHDLIIFSHCVFLIYSSQKTLTDQNLNDSRLTNIHSTSWTRLDESFHFLNHVFYTTSATKKWSYNFEGKNQLVRERKKNDEIFFDPTIYLRFAVDFVVVKKELDGTDETAEDGRRSFWKIIFQSYSFQTI